MDYKDYQILAEVNINAQCSFELDADGEPDNDTIVALTVESEGDVDIDNLADFIVYNPDGDDIGYTDTFAEAKALVDKDISDMELARQENA